MITPYQAQVENLGTWDSIFAGGAPGGDFSGGQLGLQNQQYAKMFNPAGNLNPASGGGGYSTTGGYGGVPSYGTGTASGGTGGAFTLNPAPTQGSGTTFGMVPGAIGAPPSIWQQTQSIPGEAANTAAEQSLINSQLNGQLSPTTTENLTNSAASRGLSLGQGGNTGLTNEILLNTLGLTQEQLQQQGNQNYLSFLSASGQQQQSPTLLTDIASRNATMAAAPNPTLAAEEAIALGQGTGRTSAPNFQMPSGYGNTGTSNYYDFFNPVSETGDNNTPMTNYNPPSSNQVDYLNGGNGPVDGSYASTQTSGGYQDLQNILTGNLGF